MVAVDNKANWYVVQVISGSEKKIGQSVEMRIKQYEAEQSVHEVLVPALETVEVRGKSKRTVERSLFPGYILVRMVIGNDLAWQTVRYTPGVLGFVSSLYDVSDKRKTPLPLEEDEVARIKGMLVLDQPFAQLSYKVGDSVLIKDGPFEDFVGTIEEVNNERARLRVQISFLGRETPVEFEFHQVEKE